MILRIYLLRKYSQILTFRSQSVKISWPQIVIFGNPQKYHVRENVLSNRISKQIQRLHVYRNNQTLVIAIDNSDGLLFKLSQLSITQSSLGGKHRVFICRIMNIEHCSILFVKDLKNTKPFITDNQYCDLKWHWSMQLPSKI